MTLSNRMVAALAPAMAVVIAAVGLVAWHSAHGLAPITLVEVSQVCLFLDKICFLNSRRCYSPSGSLQGFVMFGVICNVLCTCVSESDRENEKKRKSKIKL